VTTPPPSWPDAGAAVGTEAWFAYVTTHEPDGSLTQFNGTGTCCISPVGLDVAYVVGGGVAVLIFVTVAVVLALVFRRFGNALRPK
jgi:hypothetical protein